MGQEIEDSKMSVDGSRLIFVAGLHRSGTTPLTRLLAAHPAISGLHGTGVREDEGQHLQQVYPVARTYGGPGRFARDPRSHLTEQSALATPENAARLIGSWAPYWNLDRPLLLEKSPPNLVMGRFLQALFPGSAFVVVLRHPVVVALGTKKWAPRTSLHRLVGHWFAAHEQFLADLPQLNRVHVLHYEDLIADPGAELDRLQSFLELGEPISAQGLEASRSNRYEEAWARRRRRGRIESDFGEACTRFGYDVSDLQKLSPRQWA